MINYEENYLPLCARHNIPALPKDKDWGAHWEAIWLVVNTGRGEEE